MIRWSVLLSACLVSGCIFGGGKKVAAAPAPKPALSADSVWTEAEALFRRGKWAAAQRSFEKFTGLVRSEDPRAARAHYFLGETHLALDNPIVAAREFRRVADEGTDADLAPSALMRAADAYAALWTRPELDPSFGQTAIATYQEVQSRYPRTALAAKAQARVAELQEQLAYKTYRAGVYYFRLKAYDSAIIYFRDLVATYPRSPTAPEALVRLAQSYRAIGYTEELKETCGYMRKFHAGAVGVAEACRDVPTAG